MSERRGKILVGRVVESGPLCDLDLGQLKILDWTRSCGETKDFFLRTLGRELFRHNKGLLIFCMSPFVRAISFSVFL